MSRSDKKFVDIELTGITSKGQCIGRTEDGMVVFVEGNGVPGDMVKVQLNRKRKGVWNGFVKEILNPSVFRTEPKCIHFGVCGGCSWQNLEYKKQLQIKEQNVRDAMERIGKLTMDHFENILPCNDLYYYRNKLEYTFSNRKWLLEHDMKAGLDFNQNALGFHRPGTFDKIVDIQQCHLQIEISNEIRNELKRFALENDITFYDIKQHRGFLRNLIIKTNESGQVLLVLSVHERNEEQIEIIFSHLRSKFPQIVSAYVAINPKKNDSWHDLQCEKIFGEDYLMTTLDHVQFCLGPKSFFQTNRSQAEKLYQIVDKYCDLKGTETVYDLYCGVGSIGIYLARKASKIVGIEEIPEAIQDAVANAALNNLNQCEFLAGDVLQLLTPQLLERFGRPDVLIVDPPRTGIHPDVIQQIINFAPDKLVYVSCNPSTAARDIQLLSSSYRIDRIQPVDMFPMTNHVELVSCLIKI